MKKAIVIFNLILLVVLAAIWWDDQAAEWKSYQTVYQEMLLRKVGTRAAIAEVKDQRLEVKQIEVGKSERVDRCQTCHLGVENPQMIRAPEPFRRHSPIVQSHPPEKFGCTLCHDGEGRGLTTNTAHGEDKAWPRRLLKGDYIQAACFRCHGGEMPDKQAVAAVLEGQRLFKRYECSRCHQADGLSSKSDAPEAGAVVVSGNSMATASNAGPDLSTVGSRRDWAWIQAHLTSPQTLTPGSTMSAYRLTRREAKYITTYLLTLAGDKDQLDLTLLPGKNPAWPGAREKTATAAQRIAEDADGGAFAEGRDNRVADGTIIPLHRSTSDHSNNIHYDGEKLFDNLGCRYCHRVGLRGGEAGPAVTHIARKLDARKLRNLLRDPATLKRDGQMPQMYLTSAQIDALTKYLTALK